MPLGPGSPFPSAVQGWGTPSLACRAHPQTPRSLRWRRAIRLAAKNVKVVPPDLASVRAFFGFDHWPEGITHLDLGDRIVDVIPTPGHESAHIAFYDERTALLFSGDFLMPGRLTLEDTAADQKSAARVIDFLANRPLAHITGGHIERDQAGHTYAEGATYHPNERPLELSREDLMKLPSALTSFNGFYASHDDYSITQPMHNLLAVLCAAFVLFSVVAFALCRVLLWRRHRRTVADWPRHKTSFNQSLGSTVGGSNAWFQDGFNTHMQLAHAPASGGPAPPCWSHLTDPSMYQDARWRISFNTQWS